MDYWNLLILFGSCFLSSTIVPFPSEATVLYCLSIDLNPYTVLIIATIANSLGGSTNYFLGKFLAKKLKKEPSEKARILVERFGIHAAWLAWVPFVGDPIMVALGVYRTPMYFTFLFMTLGKFVRYAVLIAPFI